MCHYRKYVCILPTASVEILKQFTATIDLHIQLKKDLLSRQFLEENDNMIIVIRNKVLERKMNK